MDKTKYRNLEKSDQVMKLPQPPLALPAEDGKPIHDLPDPRGIKVNHVNAPCPCFLESPGHCHRVCLVEGRGVVVAANEADCLASKNVN